jgi:hypothetical protein
MTRGDAWAAQGAPRFEGGPCAPPKFATQVEAHFRWGKAWVVVRPRQEEGPVATR